MQADMARKEKQLEGAMARDIQRGLASVRRICRDHRIGGVHGPLIELFECEERFITPVEVREVGQGLGFWMDRGLGG